MKPSPNAPIVAPDTSLEDAVRLMLDSKCRCAIVEEDGKPLGILSMMQVVRRLAFEWLEHNKAPEVALRELHVSQITLHPPLIYSEKPKPLQALIDMLTHGTNFVIIGGYSVYTTLDALIDTVQVLRGETAGELIAAQKWWATAPHTSVKDAFLQVSMLPTWRLVLVDQVGSVVGIFSATDFLRAIIDGKFKLKSYETPVREVATKVPRVCDAEEMLTTVVHIMAEHDIYLMPVVRGVEGFVGVVHAYDIARLAAIKMLQGRS